MVARAKGISALIDWSWRKSAVFSQKGHKGQKRINVMTPSANGHHPSCVISSAVRQTLPGGEHISTLFFLLPPFSWRDPTFFFLTTTWRPLTFLQKEKWNKNKDQSERQLNKWTCARALPPPLHVLNCPSATRQGSERAWNQLLHTASGLSAKKERKTGGKIR